MEIIANSQITTEFIGGSWWISLASGRKIDRILMEDR
jgi:hypothetical protein